MIHLRGRHVKLIALEYARNSLRGGTGIIFLLVTMFVGLMVAHFCIAPIEQSHKWAQRQQQNMGGGAVPIPNQKQIHDEIIRKLGLPVARWAVGGEDEEHARHLVEKPALVSAIIIILMFILPFLVCLGSFNQFSGDIQYGRMRYLLLRTERANIFFGRFIGTAMFTFIILLFLLLVIFLYLVLKTDYYSPGEVGLWLMQAFVMMGLFALPYIALCAFISTVIDSPFGSLAICELIALFIPIFFYIASNAHESLYYGVYIMPWPWRYKLLHPNILWVIGGCVAMLAYTAFLLWCGLKVFTTRDL